MEGAYGEFGCAGDLLQPVDHLLGGFVGEGEGEDVLWYYALLDEVEDLFGDYSCFAGTGTGEDQLYAGAGKRLWFVKGRGSWLYESLVGGGFFLRIANQAVSTGFLRRCSLVTTSDFSVSECLERVSPTPQSGAAWGSVSPSRVCFRAQCCKKGYTFTQFFKIRSFLLF
jgi:hypothetical protein